MKLPIIVLTAALLLIAPPTMAQTASTVCDAEVGAAFGLCTSYCQAMDCDGSSPQASATACAKVLENWTKHAGDRVIPCKVESGGPLGEAFAACPMTDADLNDACLVDTGSLPKYFVFYTNGTSSLGPVDGKGPAICPCPGVTATLCNGLDSSAPDACFPALTKLSGTNFPGLASVERSPASTVHCFDIEGFVVCADFSSPIP